MCVAHVHMLHVDSSKLVGLNENGPTTCTVCVSTCACVHVDLGIPMSIFCLALEYQRGEERRMCVCSRQSVSSIPPAVSLPARVRVECLFDSKCRLESENLTKTEGRRKAQKADKWCVRQKILLGMNRLQHRPLSDLDLLNLRAYMCLSPVDLYNQ